MPTKPFISPSLNWPTALFIVFISSILLIFGGTARANSDLEFSKILEAARTKIKSGKLLDARKLNQNGKPVVEVFFIERNGSVRSIIIDARSGTAISEPKKVRRRKDPNKKRPKKKNANQKPPVKNEKGASNPDNRTRNKPTGRNSHQIDSNSNQTSNGSRSEPRSNSPSSNNNSSNNNSTRVNR